MFSTIISINLAQWLQILEDMEREFGISCPSGLTKLQDQEDVLSLETCDSQEELEKSRCIGQKDEEKNKVGAEASPSSS